MMFFPTSNGVVMQTGQKQVICITCPDGQKRLQSDCCANKVIFFNFPLARGVQYFFCGIYAFFCAQIWSQNLCQKSKTQKDRRSFLSIFFLVAIGAFLGALVLGTMPGKLAWAIVGADGSDFYRNLMLLVLKIALFCFLILCLRFFASVNELFKFNSAAEKAVFFAI